MSLIVFSFMLPCSSGYREAGSVNLCVTIIESLSGKAMFRSERRVPFDGEY